MQRDKLLTLLKINGVDKDAADADIRAVLTDARYSNEEIDSALYILKSDTETNQIRTDGLQKVFYTDSHLKPSEVSGLLGIDFDVSNTFRPKKMFTRELSMQQMLVVIVVAIVLGAIAVAYYMFANDTGLFHPTAIAAMR